MTSFRQRMRRSSSAPDTPATTDPAAQVTPAPAASPAGATAPPPPAPPIAGNPAGGAATAPAGGSAPGGAAPGGAAPGGAAPGGAAPSAAAAPATPAVPPAPADPREPGFATRGRLRRRLRYLRRVRELGYRDLGGLVFDQHRFQRANETLVQTKVGALAQIDGEVRALEHALHDRRAVTELREAGIAACPRCGAIHGSESRYCPACGLALTGPTEVAAVHVPTPVGSATTASAPSTPPRPVPVAVPSGRLPQSAPPFGSAPLIPPVPGPPAAPAAPGAADATIHARVGVSEQPTTVLRASDPGSATGGDPLTPPLTSGDPLAERPADGTGPDSADPNAGTR